MSSFTCQVCGAAFDVPQAALAKYPGWTPRTCRAHTQSRRSTRGRGGRRGARGGDAPPENLTLTQVLQRYSGGPQQGVFTDGSAVPNPGPGGWGFVWVEDGEVRVHGHGHEQHTTNNRMELRALIEAFRALPEDAELEVWSDSRLCVQTITQWAPKWERNGWKRKDGEVKNVELVAELLELSRARPGCTLKWIAAHSGHVWNEYADSLASAWARDVL